MWDARKDKMECFNISFNKGHTNRQVKQANKSELAVRESDQ